MLPTLDVPKISENLITQVQTDRKYRKFLARNKIQEYYTILAVKKEIATEISMLLDFIFELEESY